VEEGFDAGLLFALTTLQVFANPLPLGLALLSEPLLFSLMALLFLGQPARYPLLPGIMDPPD
jgi:hypothetical protein